MSLSWWVARPRVVVHRAQRWHLPEWSLRFRRHEFFSDACRHDEHASCPLRCEFCNAKCMCPCHRKDPHGQAPRP